MVDKYSSLIAYMTISVYYSTISLLQSDEVGSDDMSLLTMVANDNMNENKSFSAESLYLVMNPRERRLVRLVLHPKQTGDLKIIGICWKLFGEVWGRHKFQLKGKLLNDSRDNRAKRARILDTR